MTKGLLILIYVSTLGLASGQTDLKKIILYKDCPDLLKIGTVMADDLPLTDKEFTRYLKSKHPKPFSKTTLELSLVVSQTEKPCCRRLIISDSTKIDMNKIETLLDVVLKYPDFKKIKFASDGPKELLILIGTDKRGKPQGIFLPVLHAN